MSGLDIDLEEIYDSGPPYATVTRVGRLYHSIEIHQGLMCWDGWPGGAFGRKRAERKARRVLAKLIREGSSKGVRIDPPSPNGHEPVEEMA